MNRTAQDQSLRDHLTRLLVWHDAHADFEQVVANLPARSLGMMSEAGAGPRPNCGFNLRDSLQSARPFTNCTGVRR